MTQGENLSKLILNAQRLFTFAGLFANNINIIF